MKIFSTYSVKIKHYNHIFKDTVKIYREVVDFLIDVFLALKALRKSNIFVSRKEDFGLKIINAKMATDDRGTVRELFRDSIYSDLLPETVSAWKQINLTRTEKGAVRGLHRFRN